MPSALTAFLGGAAEQATKMIETEKKNAREIAAAQASAMLKNYMEVDKQAKDLSSKMSADVEFLKGYYPDISDDDLVEAAKNPEAMAVFKKKASEPDFDSRIIKFNDFVTVASKTSGKDFKTQINELYDIRKLEAAPTQAAENLSFFQRIAAGEGEAEFKRIVAPFGVTPEQLRGAMSYKPSVTSEAKFNLSGLKKRDPDEDIKRSRIEIEDAKQLPTDDPTRDTKIAEAVKLLSLRVAIKNMTTTQTLSSPQIISNMISEIQALPEDSPDRKALEKKLTERQKMEKGEIVPNEKDIRTNLINEILEARKNKDVKTEKEKTAELNQRKALTKEDETDPLKISATTLQITATKAIAAGVGSFVPAGDFTIINNLDGSQTVTLKDLSKTADYDKGMRAGHEAVFELYTQNNIARSPAHGYALAAIGFRVEPETYKVLAFPQNPRAVPSAPAPAAPAPAAAAPTPAPAAPPPAAKPRPLSQQEFDTKWPTLKAGQSLIGPDGKTYTKK
jgi:hypothetical protein